MASRHDSDRAEAAHAIMAVAEDRKCKNRHQRGSPVSLLIPPRLCHQKTQILRRQGDSHRSALARERLFVARLLTKSSASSKPSGTIRLDRNGLETLQPAGISALRESARARTGSKTVRHGEPCHTVTNSRDPPVNTPRREFALSAFGVSPVWWQYVAASGRGSRLSPQHRPRRRRGAWEPHLRAQIVQTL